MTTHLPRPEPINDKPGPRFEALLKKHKISPVEYAKIRDQLGRTPTMAELGVFSAMWSEHCSYKSSRVHLKRFPTTGPNVVVGPGENAGVVRLSGKLCLAFKMESHNHPSYIEPYQGAATGVGGILRDVFCMGARPIANLNALRFGERAHVRTRFLVENCVRGIGDYGNCIGVPTVGGSISFDASYNGNCLVNAMTIGVIHEDRIFKGYASGAGNLVVYVGSATGRDGIHGASMASDSFQSAESGERSTVQVGDPFTEKLLLEATLEVLDKELVVGLQDMGAAGLTSSSFEMAGRAGNGLYIDLDQVPVRTTAMTAYELLLSESQERMLMVIKPENWTALKDVLDRWQLHSAVIGNVTTTGRVEVVHKGRLEVDLPVALVTDDAPRYERPIQQREKAQGGADYDGAVAAAVRSRGVEDVLRECLRDTGDKAPIFNQYDRHIGIKTVFASDDQGAAVLWLRSDWSDPSEPYLGALASVACNERYTRVAARAGASHAVLKAARMIAAAGGEPLALTDCLNYGNPEDPQVMGDLSDGVDGIADACRALRVPVVSGNVSLYNTTDGVSIAPTPMIGMVGRMHDVRGAASAVVKDQRLLYLLHPRGLRPSFGGSLVSKVLGLGGRYGTLPEIAWDAEVEAMRFLQSLAAAGALAAARDVGDGGIATTAAKMTLGAGLGFELDLSEADMACERNAIVRYLGEVAGAYLIALREDEDRETLLAAKSLGYNALVRVGRVLRGSPLRWGGWELATDRAGEALRVSLSL